MNGFKISQNEIDFNLIFKMQKYALRCFLEWLSLNLRFESGLYKTQGSGLRRAGNVSVGQSLGLGEPERRNKEA